MNKNKVSEINKEPLDIIGFIMVVLPLVSSVLLWYWFYNIDLVKNMYYYLISVVISTVLLTTIIATVDSHRLGLKVKIYKRKEIYGGSFLKFFIFLLLWIYSYPVYLFRRKNYGSRNLLFPMIFTLLIFILSSIYLYRAAQARLELDRTYSKRVEYYRNVR
jgi:hypothetical protein